MINQIQKFLVQLIQVLKTRLIKIYEMRPNMYNEVPRKYKVVACQKRGCLEAKPESEQWHAHHVLSTVRKKSCRPPAPPKNLGLKIFLSDLIYCVVSFHAARVSFFAFWRQKKLPFGHRNTISFLLACVK